MKSLMKLDSDRFDFATCFMRKSFEKLTESSGGSCAILHQSRRFRSSTSRWTMNFCFELVLWENLHLQQIGSLLVEWFIAPEMSGRVYHPNEMEAHDVSEEMTEEDDFKRFAEDRDAKPLGEHKSDQNC